MIRVTIEVLPLGLTNTPSKNAVIEIHNTGGSVLDPSKGDYIAKLYEVHRGSERGRLWKTTKIVNFPRQRRNLYDLLFRVLKETVAERNEPTQLG